MPLGPGSPMKPVTPAIRQYLQIKSQYPDAILFFRMGDFYEMFFEDAEVASKELEIALTSRDKGHKDSIPLCGVPYFEVEGILPLNRMKPENEAHDP